MKLKRTCRAIRRIHDALHFIQLTYSDATAIPMLLGGSPSNPAATIPLLSYVLPQRRIHCAFAHERLCLFGLVDPSVCPSCTTEDNLKPPLPECRASHENPEQLFSTLHFYGHPCEPVKDILFPSGSRGAARDLLPAPLRYLSKSS